MAAESIGTLVPTKIPGLSDQADIQAALRLYHYGSYDFDTAETDSENLINPSIAYTLNDLQVQVDGLDVGATLKKADFNAKGDILSASANDTLSVLSVGTNGQVLTANSSTTTGLQWATPSVTPSNSISLSGKSISLGSNTITGTIAEFNTALSDGNFATLAGSEALSGKTLTAPTFVDEGYIQDTSSNKLLAFNSESSAVNYLKLSNSAAAQYLSISAEGTDTNIDINLATKGAGIIRLNGLPFGGEDDDLRIETIMGSLA